MSHKKPPPGTQAVLRAIALLKAFTGDKPEMDLPDLADQVDLTRTTTHRLLSALESEDLVAKDPLTHDYRLGPAAIALGSRALRTNDLRNIARPYLESLAARTRETATLEVLVDGRMLILDEVLGAHLVGTTPSVGTAWAIHATSTGKVLLAHLTETDRKKLLKKPLTRYTPRTITNCGKLRKEFEQARQRGYAIAAEELEEGYVAVGAAVTGPLGNPVGSLSVGGPSVRLKRDQLSELRKLVTAAARKVSIRLGYETTDFK